MADKKIDILREILEVERGFAKDAINHCIKFLDYKNMATSVGIEWNLFKELCLVGMFIKLLKKMKNNGNVQFDKLKEDLKIRGYEFINI